jgi:hypothetical protein
MASEFGRERMKMQDSVLRDRRLPPSADVGQRPTPQTTIEAILHCVRVGGTKALHEPANIER